VKYRRDTGIHAEVNGLCVHSVRATAPTSAPSNEADSETEHGEVSSIDFRDQETPNSHANDRRQTSAGHCGHPQTLKPLLLLPIL
jgi:hypothetical protein